MTKNTAQTTQTIIWILCILLGIAGIGICIHALLNFNQANVIVEWTTASELDTVGFNLLRGETENGPFEQVNVALIPSVSDTLTGSSYSYEDTQVIGGTTYFYMLEEIESSGNASQFGPIIVKANSPMQIELVVGILLMLGAGVYIVLLLRDQRKQVARDAE
ncbi:MAG TPA: hypothetical protein DEH25_14105 [Chloroflexi bacterium]|nr:hypothetical protein [Chloroflexota bacterium]HBY07433.1 hypothetical protein [Chloroflexota bacterium]